VESNPRSGELNTEIADQQRGLIGEALIDDEREGEVQRAIAAARDKAAKDQVRFNNAQAEAIRQQVELEFEATKGAAARARVQREAVTAPVDRLVEQRRALQEQIDAAHRGGNTNLAGMLEEQAAFNAVSAAGGGNGSGETRVVNVFDSAAAIEAALQTPAGGRAILNFVQENPRAFKSAMGA
jgi:hypothetical protein